MFDENDGSIDEQGRKLGNAFARAETEEQKPRNHWRVPAVTVAAAAAAAAILFLVIGVGRESKVFTLDEAVAAVSEAAFDLPGSEPDKYVYFKSRRTDSGGLEGHVVRSTYDNESWIREGEPTYWERFTLFSPDLSKSASGICERKVHPEYGTPLDVAKQLQLPTGEKFPKNSAELYRLLEGKQDDDPDGLYNADEKVWDSIGQAMQSGATVFTPEQRAVLIGALAMVPGATTLGRIKDPNGNDAIGFERFLRDNRDRIYFDAKTSVTTYTETTLTKPDKKWYPNVPVGTQIFSYQLLDFRNVDKLPGLKEYSPGKVKLGKETTDFGKC